MAKTTDFLSQTSGKLTDQFTTRQTAFGTILARTPKKTANPKAAQTALSEWNNAQILRDLADYLLERSY